MSSILSTSSCGEGTHTTSLPDWPTSGVNSALGAWAKAQTAIAEKIRIDRHRLAERVKDIFFLHMVLGEGKAGGDSFATHPTLAPPRSAPAAGRTLRAENPTRTCCRRDSVA